MRTLQEAISMLAEEGRYAILFEGEYLHPNEFYTEIHTQFGDEGLKFPCEFFRNYICYGRKCEMEAIMVRGKWDDKKGFIPIN